MITYPNQKVLHINKGNYTSDYLTIGINEWVEASKNLKPITFKLYLYLASNADGYDKPLSRQDVMNKLGVTKNSYHSGVEELIEKGYIVPKQGNIYDFYTKPMYHSNGTSDKGMYQYNGTVCTTPMVHDVPLEEYSMYQYNGTEINNIYNINKTNELASLDAANADKWIPKDDKSKEIFMSDAHTDKDVIRIINLLWDELDYFGRRKTIEEICNDTAFTSTHTNLDKVREYCIDMGLGA